MKKTTLALALVALTLSTAAQARYQPAEQAANRAEILDSLRWHIVMNPGFCFARSWLEIC
jgi:hypothetical protein